MSISSVNASSLVSNQVNLDSEIPLAIKEEFKELQNSSLRNSPLCRPDDYVENLSLSANRYIDILPYKKTNVPLKDWPYVNASYILARKQDYFILEAPVAIATQCPLQYDAGFWTMLNESSSEIIISLGPTDRKFWEDQKFTHFEISSTDPLEHNDSGLRYSERTLTVNTKNRKQNTVTHLIFEDWPDHGVTDPAHLGKLIQQIQGKVLPIVHCRAGIGRTGVFLAVFLAYKYNMSIKEAVELLRNPQRGRHYAMVENLEQYHLAHQTLDWLKNNSSN